MKVTFVLCTAPISYWEWKDPRWPEAHLGSKSANSLRILSAEPSAVHDSTEPLSG